MNAPPAVESQRAEGLRRANEIRLRRAKLKRLMAEGRISLSDVLEGDKCHLRTMLLRDLLLAVPSLGPSKVHRALTSRRISPTVTLENFSMRRRLELLAWLEASYPRLKGRL